MELLWFGWMLLYNTTALFISTGMIAITSAFGAHLFLDLVAKPVWMTSERATLVRSATSALAVTVHLNTVSYFLLASDTPFLLHIGISTTAIMAVAMALIFSSLFLAAFRGILHSGPNLGLNISIKIKSLVTVKSLGTVKLG